MHFFERIDARCFIKFIEFSIRPTDMVDPEDVKYRFLGNAVERH